MFPFTGFPHQSADLLVLNMHSTPAGYINEFRNIMEFLSKYFSLESASYIEEHYAFSAINRKQPAVVFTFDDGLRNNLHAASLLEEFGIKGLFFVVPDFFQSPEELQEQYYRNNIRRIINPHYDRNPEDLRAMRLNELMELKSRGHIIGSHSMSHTLNTSDDEFKLKKEIIGSKELLDESLRQQTKHFCAPFNSLNSVSERAMQIISENYQYFHSTMPGSNSTEKNSLFIRRVNIEAFWMNGAVKFACSRTEWRRWEKYINSFNNLFTNNIKSS